MKSFEELEVYQKSFDFTIDIFKLTENLLLIRTSFIN